MLTSSGTGLFLFLLLLALSGCTEKEAAAASLDPPEARQPLEAPTISVAPVLGDRAGKAARTLRAVRNGADADWKPACEILRASTSNLAGEVMLTDKLCAEASAAPAVKTAIAEARANPRANKSDVPQSCYDAMPGIKAIDSGWARARLADLVDACWIQHGKRTP